MYKALIRYKDAEVVGMDEVGANDAVLLADIISNTYNLEVAGNDVLDGKTLESKAYRVRFLKGKK